MTKPSKNPTTEPQFQKVVQHFLKTPPKPHKEMKRKGGPQHRPAKPPKSKPKSKLTK